jgi:hypothetical protein
MCCDAIEVRRLPVTEQASTRNSGERSELAVLAAPTRFPTTVFGKLERCATMSKSHS